MVGLFCVKRTWFQADNHVDLFVSPDFWESFLPIPAMGGMPGKNPDNKPGDGTSDRIVPHVAGTGSLSVRNSVSGPLGQLSCAACLC